LSKETISTTWLHKNPTIKIHLRFRRVKQLEMKIIKTQKKDPRIEYESDLTSKNSQENRIEYQQPLCKRTRLKRILKRLVNTQIALDVV